MYNSQSKGTREFRAANSFTVGMARKSTCLRKLETFDSERKIRKMIKTAIRSASERVLSRKKKFKSKLCFDGRCTAKVAYTRSAKVAVNKGGP